jgi:hypothetical protein
MVSTLVSKDAPPLPDSEPAKLILPSTKKIEFPRRDAKPAVVVAPGPETKPRTPPPSVEEKPLGAVRIVLIMLAAAVVAFTAVTLVRVATSTTEPPVETPTTAADPSVATPPVVVPKKTAAPGLVAKIDALPDSVQVAPDKGLIEVNIGADHPIYVDGSFMGRGPMRRLTSDPGKHEVKLRTPDGEQVLSIEVTAGRCTFVTIPEK